LFYWINQHPESIEGHLEVSTSHLYRTAGGDAGICSWFWLLLFICIGQFFFLGGCLGLLINRNALSKWKEKVTPKEGDTKKHSKGVPVFAPDRISKIQSELLGQIQSLDKSDQKGSAMIKWFLKQSEDYETQKMDDPTYIHTLKKFDSFLRGCGIIPRTRYCCSSCGKENKLWYKYCTDCGAQYTCTTCGKENGPWDKYCIFCGEKIINNGDSDMITRGRD
jgi:hypothetical protein